MTVDEMIEQLISEHGCSPLNRSIITLIRAAEQLYEATSHAAEAAERACFFTVSSQIQEARKGYTAAVKGEEG